MSILLGLKMAPKKAYLLKPDVVSLGIGKSTWLTCFLLCFCESIEILIQSKDVHKLFGAEPLDKFDLIFWDFVAW